MWLKWNDVNFKRMWFLKILYWGLMVTKYKKKLALKIHVCSLLLKIFFKEWKLCFGYIHVHVYIVFVKCIWIVFYLFYELYCMSASSLDLLLLLYAFALCAFASLPPNGAFCRYCRYIPCIFFTKVPNHWFNSNIWHNLKSNLISLSLHYKILTLLVYYCSVF